MNNPEKGIYDIRWGYSHPVCFYQDSPKERLLGRGKSYQEYHAVEIFAFNDSVSLKPDTTTGFKRAINIPADPALLK